eukprot:TRINITY_DN9545_c0_g1_i1.p1 TRINITY_DN9545_c0_g1~~TRINITY_DN9545_c0_g1_i1.p1  ORF type:complete len:167 (-),score=24.77 TRINITY_DN9545_c0_g1_i1:262-762(-)
MADNMWGGIPFQLPSKTAIKYLGRAVKVKRECDIPIGGRYNTRQTMDREIIGHRQVRKDLQESYEKYSEMRRRTRSVPLKVNTCSGVSENKMTAGHEYERPLDPIYYHERCCCFRPCLTRCPMFKITRPQVTNTEPRTERFIGMVDVRKHLPGYINGKRVRPQYDD